MAKSFYNIAAGKSNNQEDQTQTWSNASVGKLSTGDTIAGNSGTAEILAVGGSNTGFINDLDDLDWFAITLTAGESYVFNTAGNGATPINDTILTLFDSNSTQLTTNDDASSGGLYSEITFTAQSTGTYYLQVDGYGNTADGYTPSTGGYSLSAASIPTPSVLPTLDWGGTNNVATTNGVINVYFAGNGETFDGRTSIGWDATEEAAAVAAFDQFSDYINVSFNVVNTAAASDFQMVQIASLGGGTLGYFNPPGSTNEGVGVFADDGAGWDAAGLAQGGYGFITLIHEIGHGLGLAHPHDGGGNSTVMNGVTGPQGSYGTYGLNQGIFTMMSYNDGWPLGPSGASNNNGYGWAGTAMALDIAVLQEKYGANATNESGNSTYTLSSNNAAGTFYSSIWDTGGADLISYSGSANATIDLREATLLEETNGGGYVSFVAGVHGGYTIANGAVIENATGGSGADTLTGNDAANILTGNAGNDVLDGGAGVDRLYGGAGADQFHGGAGNDVFYADADDTLVDGGAGVDSLVASGTVNLATLGLNSVENILGSAGADNFTAAGMAESVNIYAGGGNDIVTGGNGNDILRGQAGADQLYGGNGGDILYFDADDTIVNGGSGWDYAYSSGNINLSTINFVGIEQILGSNGVDNFDASGMTAGVRLYGNAADDTLTGGSGDDYFYGGADNDILIGNNGTDRLIGQTGADELYGGAGIDYLYFDGDDTVVNGGTGWDIGIIDGNVVLTDASRLDTEQVFGRNNNDVLDGSALTSEIRLYGYGGDDTLTGGSGDDYLYSGTGADSLSGGAGNDTLTVDAADILVDGGAGTDTAIIGGNVTLTSIGLTAIENVVGSSAADTLNATGITDNLSIYGRNGNDTLTGGSGADRLYGEAGADSLSGGGGNDYIYFEQADTLVDGGAGWDVGVLTGADIILTGAMFQNMEQVLANGADNSLDASALTSDVRLYAGAGDDLLIGGSGDDYLYGQAGSDTFAFDANWGRDIVGDFDATVDTLDLTDLNIGPDFSQITIQAAGVNTEIYITADGSADNLITLLNVDSQDIDPGNLLI